MKMSALLSFMPYSPLPVRNWEEKDILGRRMFTIHFHLTLQHLHQVLQSLHLPRNCNPNEYTQEKSTGAQ